jgi:hypothetical protein
VRPANRLGYDFCVPDRRGYRKRNGSRLLQIIPIEEEPGLPARLSGADMFQYLKHFNGSAHGNIVVAVVDKIRRVRRLAPARSH